MANLAMTVGRVLALVALATLVVAGDEEYCASFPCLNQGQCVENWHSSPPFMCICPAGYGGATCERPKLNCTAVDCQNGGVCQETPNDAYCRCPYYTDGKNCETVIEGCIDNPCRNGGICTVVFDNEFVPFTCECPHLYTGPRCMDDNPCQDVDCHNGGTCELFEGVSDDGDDEAECSCLAGFIGDYCEEEMRTVSEDEIMEVEAARSASFAAAVTFGLLFGVTAIAFVAYVIVQKRKTPHIPWFGESKTAAAGGQDDNVALQEVDSA